MTTLTKEEKKTLIEMAVITLLIWVGAALLYIFVDLKTAAVPGGVAFLLTVMTGLIYLTIKEKNDGRAPG